MANISAQSSPKKLDRELSAEKPESPILPPEHLHVEPLKLTSLDRMTEPQSNVVPKPQGGRAQVKTPEPRTSKERMNNHKELAERSPSTPGHLAPFDWDEFETRYEEALKDTDRSEKELIDEFEALVKYFNVWAAAASVHDTERGIKRLQTRERYVRLSEQNLLQKKKHCEYWRASIHLMPEAD